MQNGSGIAGLIFWVIIMGVIFYLMIYRPQKKQEKAARILRNSITPGDIIETIGGFTGRVLQVKGDDVVFETGADRTKLVVKNWGVRARVVPNEESSANNDVANDNNADTGDKDADA